MNAALPRALPLRACALLIALSVMPAWVHAAYGQAETMWLNIGDFHHKYSSVATEPSCCIRREGKSWPGILKRREQTTQIRNALWIGVKNFTDERGEHWDYKVAHAGPRVYAIGSEVFPKPMRLIGRFEAPEVNVDGLQSFDQPVALTLVDPKIKADRLLIREMNTVTGISMKNTVYAFSQAFHDDYHVHEYVFTNTGNTDADADVELPNQTLEGVYFYFANKEQFRPAETLITAKGANTMVDYFGDGKEDYPTHHRAFVAWHGATPWAKGNALGTPVWSDDNRFLVKGDSVGRLAAAYMLTRTTLHADKSAVDETDDPNQPAHTGFIRGGDPITNGNEHTNREQMRDEYAYMAVDQGYADYGDLGGHQYPHHADLVAPAEPKDDWYERMARQKELPSLQHSGGWVGNMAYGPYTLKPGESVRLVWVEGFAGLSMKAAIEIGRAYKRSRADDDLLIPFDANGDGQIDPATEQRTKNHWVLTSRDSIFQMLDRAEANLQSGFNIPQPPRPPRRFNVTSGADRIMLEWETFDDENPPGGFEIYRTRNQYEGAVEDDWTYQRIATLGPSERRFEDTDVQRGISYYYYIQAVGAVNTDPTGLTPTGVPLKSSRYYTQTYDPAFLKRAAGSSIDAARAVPNPYNLASDKNVRWPDQQDKIAFLEIPGNCTIKIYTEIGELIREIEHTDGSGDAYWNLTTSSNQVVASGIYFAVIRDNDTGEQTVLSLAIIR